MSKQSRILIKTLIDSLTSSSLFKCVCISVGIHLYSYSYVVWLIKNIIIIIHDTSETNPFTLQATCRLLSNNQIEY